MGGEGGEVITVLDPRQGKLTEQRLEGEGASHATWSRRFQGAGPAGAWALGGNVLVCSKISKEARVGGAE